MIMVHKDPSSQTYEGVFFWKVETRIVFLV